MILIQSSWTTTLYDQGLCLVRKNRWRRLRVLFLCLLCDGTVGNIVHNRHYHLGCQISISGNRSNPADVATKQHRIETAVMASWLVEVYNESSPRLLKQLSLSTQSPQNCQIKDFATCFSTFFSKSLTPLSSLFKVPFSIM